jgi:hypothetical protein
VVEKPREMYSPLPHLKKKLEFLTIFIIALELCVNISLATTTRMKLFNNN